MSLSQMLGFVWRPPISALCLGSGALQVWHWTLLTPPLNVFRYEVPKIYTPHLIHTRYAENCAATSSPCKWWSTLGTNNKCNTTWHTATQGWRFYRYTEEPTTYPSLKAFLSSKPERPGTIDLTPVQPLSGTMFMSLTCPSAEILEGLKTGSTWCPRKLREAYLVPVLI